MSGKAGTKNGRNFGSPGYGKHLFWVQIPSGSTGDVEIWEDFGFVKDGEDPTSVKRAVLPRGLWTEIKDDAAKDFNSRLKTEKKPAGIWRAGRNELDRFLGRELCVLAWAAEHASKKECAIVCGRWKSLKPEERWWLYSKTVAEAGHAEDKDRGWRKALYCSLSDGENIMLDVKVQLKKKEAIPRMAR